MEVNPNMVVLGVKWEVSPNMVAVGVIRVPRVKEREVLTVIYNLIVIQKIRDGLAKRGNRTIRSIGRCFRLLDSYDNNRKVEPEEFAVGMRENGVNLTQ